MYRVTQKIMAMIAFDKRYNGRRGDCEARSPLINYGHGVAAGLRGSGWGHQVELEQPQRGTSRTDSYTCH